VKEIELLLATLADRIMSSGMKSGHPQKDTAPYRRWCGRFVLLWSKFYKERFASLISRQRSVAMGGFMLC